MRKGSAEIVSVSDLNGLQKASIYPNPAQNYLNLEFNAKFSSTANISITNVLGQVVYQEVNPIRLGQQTIQLKINTLEAGSYFINLESKIGSINLPFIKK